MKILITSYPFYPSIGGIETVTELLADEFVALGHMVKVVTMTPSSATDRFPYEVHRRPPPQRLLSAIRWCDVVLQNQISLQFAWPLLLVRRPWVIAQLHPLGDEVGLSGLAQRLKRAIIRRCRHVVACSRAIAHQLGNDSMTVIPNPYRDRVFRLIGTGARDYDLVFLGRLVSDKGLKILLEALALLGKRGVTPSLLILGDGPERQALESQCSRLDLSARVHFAGGKSNEEVAALLNRARIMVIPSLVEEGFGIVALEGIACGCVIAASRTGGLPEAVGPCGVVLPKGNAEALAAALHTLLRDERAISDLRARAAEHLLRHQPATVAKAYLEILLRAVGPQGGEPVRSPGH